MTTKKINKTEFEEWGKRIWKLSETVLNEGEESLETKAKISKVVSAFCVGISSKNTFALEVFSNLLEKRFKEFLEETRETKFDFPCEDGVERKMTGEEWKEYLHQRVEDHHKTRVGKDLRDEDLLLIEERLNKIKALEEGKEEEKKQLLLEIHGTNKEDYDLIYGILDLRKKYFDITQSELFNMIGSPEESIQKSPYLFEDLSQILFRAQEAIEKEKDEPKVPEKKQKENIKEEKKHQIKTLEEEIKELERQNKDLKEELSKASLAPEKKVLLEENLKENNKQRETTQAKLDSLQRELKNTTDNDKSNLALGLGIFAAVVAVICLIIVLARPSRRNQY